MGMMWWTRKGNTVEVLGKSKDKKSDGLKEAVDKALDKALDKLPKKEEGDSCPSNAVCAYEYKGQLYKTEDEIKKVKELEIKRATEARVHALAIRLAVAFEKRKGLDRRYAGMAVTYLHREAIQDLLENYDEVGELLRKAKGIPKIQKVTEGTYEVEDE